MSSTSTAEEKACDKNGRIRTENWEYAHKVDLIDIIREHVNVIENKKTDAGINRKKNDAWSKVYSAFCTKHGNKRNLKQLKNQWKNIKTNAKKSYANYEKEKAKTGGGPPPEPPTGIYAEIQSLIPAEFKQFYNPYDDDEELGDAELPNEETTAEEQRYCNFSKGCSNKNREGRVTWT